MGVSWKKGVALFFIIALFSGLIFMLIWKLRKPTDLNLEFNPSPVMKIETYEPVTEISSVKVKTDATMPETEETISGSVDIFGAVRNETGDPIDEARVEVMQTTKAASADAMTFTAEDGTYSLAGLRMDNPYPYEVVASSSGYASSSSGEFFFDHAPKELNFILLKGSTLTGRVMDEVQAGIAGAILRLVGRSRKSDYAYFYLAGSRGIQASTDARGEYLYENVSPGEYWLYVYARGHIDKERNFTILPGGEDHRQDIVMESSGDGYLSGAVINELGQPVEKARVIGVQELLGNSLADYVERWCHTSSGGRFILEDFVRGSDIHLEVNMEGYKRYVKIYKPNKRGLTIQLEPVDKGTAGISGRVVDAASLEPVTSFQIDVLEMHADSRRYWSQGAIIKTRPGDSHKFQSADGGFRIDGLVAHDKDAGGPYYYLNVSAAGYAKHVLRSIKPKPNENKDLGDVKLEAGASVAGTVNDLHTRNPIPGTLVYLENKTRNLRSFPGIVRNTTDELGRYQLEGVPQGDQYIIASHPDYAIGISEKAEIQEASEYESVDILLGSGGTVEGKVSEEENPLEGVMIGICPIDTPYFEVEKTTKLGPEFQTATDINGGYRINGVTAGYCLISARIPMPTQYAGKKSPQEYVKRFQEVVELQEGETTIFNIDICLGSTVGGKLIGEDPPGTLIPINVYLRPSDAPPIGLDNDGTLILHVPSIEITGTSRGHWYKFEDVCPGDYTITAFCRCTSEMTIWQTSIPVTIKSEEAFQLDIDCTDPAVDTCDSVDLKIKQ